MNSLKSAFIRVHRQFLFVSQFQPAHRSRTSSVRCCAVSARLRYGLRRFALPESGDSSLDLNSRTRQRKPRLLTRYSGERQFRYAARTYRASECQLPPRITRSADLSSTSSDADSLGIRPTSEHHS